MDAFAPSGRADSDVERGSAAMFMLCCCESGVRGGVIFSLGRVDFVTLLSAASVVPRLVEDKAAPAANASRGRYPKPTLSRAIERAIGRPIPVRAQKMERGRFERRSGRLVDKPPGSRTKTISIISYHQQARVYGTFKNN